MPCILFHCMKGHNILRALLFPPQVFPYFFLFFDFPLCLRIRSFFFSLLFWCSSYVCCYSFMFRPFFCCFVSSQPTLSPFHRLPRRFFHIVLFTVHTPAACASSLVGWNLSGPFACLPEMKLDKTDH